LKKEDVDIKIGITNDKEKKRVLDLDEYLARNDEATGNEDKKIHRKDKRHKTIVMD
jgi:hypothetical protein